VSVIESGREARRKKWRQSGSIFETTPDARGNVLYLLERMIGSKFATKYRRDVACNVYKTAMSPQRPKPVPINAMHCNGQRGDNLIGKDTRRSKKVESGRLKVESYELSIVENLNYWIIYVNY